MKYAELLESGANTSEIQAFLVDSELVPVTIRHATLPQSDLLAYVTALCDRTAKAASIVSFGEYPHCKDAYTPLLMTLLTHLRDTQGEINVLRSRYRDKETALAEWSRLRMALKKKERERDKLATEIKELCHG